jgi:hypothetical protein
VRTNLGDLGAASIEAPSTIVIGAVAAFDFEPTVRRAAVLEGN